MLGHYIFKDKNCHGTSNLFHGSTVASVELKDVMTEKKLEDPVSKIIVVDGKIRF